MTLLELQARNFGWQLTPQQLTAFQVYADELAEWNQRANLTAIVEPDAVQIKHFLDSLTCLLAFPAGQGLSVLDVGSGAGFPGLPLKIARPDLRLTLLESVGKKADFLRHMIERLDVHDARVVQGRAEDAGQDATERESYDVVLARSVAELRVLAELALPFCRVGGVAILQKRAGIAEEIANAARAIPALGGVLHDPIAVDLPTAEPRQLVVIAKVSPTPAKYPRRAGAPQKRPL